MMSTLWWVCVAVLAAGCVEAAKVKDAPNVRLARGLNREIASHFTDGFATFSCDNGAMVLPQAAINDDYCDCADGTDEYGTNACPQGTFYCRNKLFVPLVLPSGRLDDGVCDCCDGSDEPPGSCPQLCDQHGQKRRAHLLERKAAMEKGLAKRKEMEQKGKEILEAKKKELLELVEVLKSKKPAQEAASKDLEEKKDAYMLKESAVFKAEEERKRVEEEAKKKLEEEQAETLAAAATEPAGKAEPAEPMKIEGDPNVDINMMVHGGIEPPIPGTTVEAAPAPPPQDPMQDPELVALRDAKVRAREVFDQVDTEVRDLEDKRREAERVTTMRVDGDMCLVQLGTECIDGHEKYSYTVCPLKEAKQDMTDIGHFQEWVGEDTVPLAKRQMKFDEGTHCWNGPKRNTLVTFRCGPENRLVKANEPNRCTYAALVETPCACSQEDVEAADAALKAMFQDDLD